MHRCASSKCSDTRDERVMLKGKDSKSLDRSISYFQLSDTRLCDVKGNLSSHHRAEQEADKAGIPEWRPWPWKMFRVEEEAAFPPFKGTVHPKMKSVSSFIHPHVVSNLEVQNNIGSHCMDKKLWDILQNNILFHKRNQFGRTWVNYDRIETFSLLFSNLQVLLQQTHFAQN